MDSFFFVMILIQETSKVTFRLIWKANRTMELEYTIKTEMHWAVSSLFLIFLVASWVIMHVWLAGHVCTYSNKLHLSESRVFFFPKHIISSCEKNFDVYKPVANIWAFILVHLPISHMQKRKKIYLLAIHKLQDYKKGAKQKYKINIHLHT